MNGPTSLATGNFLRIANLPKTRPPPHIPRNPNHNTMKNIATYAAATLAAIALPSCLQNETTIHLNKDGSGTIVEETTFGAQAVAMMAQMSAIGGPDAKDPIADMFSEEKAKARASKLGEGVTFEKSVPIAKDGGKGATITYHFADINKLRITPGEGMNDLSPEPAEKAADSKPVTFSYSDGTLILNMPHPEKAAGAPEDAKTVDPAEMGEQEQEMMKQMMGDMKMSVKLVVEPGIAETDATNHEGNTITLMSMEMGKVLKNPEAFKKLQATNQENPTAAMEALKGIDGVKIEPKTKVTVKVK